jgi:hypothetical protein
VSCTTENNSVDYVDETMPNGKYCARIEYQNSKTGNESEYHLYVDVEDGYLTKIYWPNGGWLDDSHFEPPEIFDYTADFINDMGYKYSVEIDEAESKCENCYSMLEEDRIEDSLQNDIELRKKELELALLEQELRISHMGHRVIVSGCTDLFIVELDDSYAVCKKVGLPVEINAGNRLECEIHELGITSVGNLTAHDAGNVDVMAITSTKGQAQERFDEICQKRIERMYN